MKDSCFGTDFDKIECCFQNALDLCAEESEVGRRCFFVCCAECCQGNLFEFAVAGADQRFLELVEQVERQLTEWNFAFMRKVVAVVAIMG